MSTELRNNALAALAKHLHIILHSQSNKGTNTRLTEVGLDMANVSKPTKPVRLDLFADYHQIHLFDDGMNPDLAEAWTVQATEDKLAVAEGGLGIGTQEADTLSVIVAIHASEPTTGSDADHVTEGSIEIKSGQLVALGCTDYLPDAKRIAVVAGWYRVRVSHSGLAKREKITIALWPSPRADPRVVKRWTPLPLEKPKRQSKIKNAKQAAHAARRGHLDEAIPVLEELANAGEGAACASLSEILAFQGKWADFVSRAEVYFVDPSVEYAGNVFTDLTRLFRRAARELGTPEIIERAAAKIPAKYTSQTQASLLKDLVRPSQRVAEPTPEETKAYEGAVATATTSKRFAGKTKDLGRHCFALATMYNIEPEIHRLWNEVGDGLQFDDALKVARWHSFRQNPSAAWAIIEQTVVRWLPVGHAQVAPVELLVDPLLSPLMNAERCDWVLAQPKGPQ